MNKSWTGILNQKQMLIVLKQSKISKNRSQLYFKSSFNRIENFLDQIIDDTQKSLNQKFQQSQKLIPPSLQFLDLGDWQFYDRLIHEIMPLMKTQFQLQNPNLEFNQIENKQLKTQNQNYDVQQINQTQAQTQQYIGLIDKLQQIEPDHLEFMYEKANILTKLQGFQEAIQIYQDIIKMNPKHDLSYQKIADILSYQKQYQQSIEYYDQCISINVNNLDAQFGKGECLRKTYQYKEALQYFIKVTENESSKLDYYFGYGDCLLYLYKYDEALKNYDKCLKIDDNHDDSQAGKGTCLLLLGKKDVALEYINQSLKIKQNSCLSQIKPQKYSIIFYLIHQVLFYKYIVAIKEQLDYEEALEQFENVLIIDPEYLYSLYNKGNFILYFYRQLLIFYGSI